VMATTRHLEVTPEMIAEDLRNFIEIEMPWQLDATTIEVTPPAQELVVPDGQIEFRWMTNPQYRFLGAGAFRCDILVDGRVERSLQARARVESYGEVVVATTDISRSEPLTARNTRIEKRELSDLEDGVFYDLDSIQMDPPYRDFRFTGGPEFWGMNDDEGRLVMIANQNNDLGEFWEWVDKKEFPFQPAAKSMRLGINYLIYAMTH